MFFITLNEIRAYALLSPVHYETNSKYPANHIFDNRANTTGLTGYWLKYNKSI